VAVFPAVIMRGGTSKAVFFKDEDLPADPEVRDRVILAAFGSPDPYGRQIDGLGGATSTTSKVAIIGRGYRPLASRNETSDTAIGRPKGVDVTYTFGQVSIDRPLVDGRGNCGNISSAVGPFAVDEGLVAAVEPTTPVRFLNTNTGKVIVAHVPTADGRFNPEGDLEIPGVPGTGARVQLDYLDPGGAVTGRLLPTGNVTDVLDVPGVGRVRVSLVDAANPLVFCSFADVGLTGKEPPAEVDADQELLERLEAVRAEAAVACGIAATPAEATRSAPSVPKLAMVGPPTTYDQLDGTVRAAGEFDLLARMLSMGKLHRAYPLTGAICTTVAANIPGTVVADALGGVAGGAVRLGHPSGVLRMSAAPQQVDGEWTVEKVSADRTARRLMEGKVYVPDAALHG
jgi:2-methylaconitate cis-trans-isomerase PrpF